MVDPRFQKIKEILPLNTSRSRVTRHVCSRSFHFSDAGLERGLSYLEMMAIVVIILGSVLLIIGFLGCCGAMKQVKLFLTCVSANQLIVSIPIWIDFSMPSLLH